MSRSTPAVRRQKQLQSRRNKAAGLFEQGLSQSEIARRLGVTPASVCRWHQAWRGEGIQGLEVAKHLGRPRRLSAEQVEELESALLEGPGAHGFRTELWTLPRVGELIRRKFGVRYCKSNVWNVMRRLGWSLQRPTTRASERDEDAIATWKKEHWPKLKKGAAGRKR